MLVYKTDTDQEADVTVWANGKELVEHVWPNAKSEVEHPYIRECFIKVAKDDRITVKGALRGTFYNASFDLLGDGSLIGHVRGDNRTGDAKKRTRKFEFTEGISAKIGDAVDTEESAGRLDVGNLRVIGIANKVLHDAKEEYAGSSRSNWRPGLGSIAVIINISQTDTDERYGDKEFDITLGNWALRNQTTRKSGIPPTQQLTLDQKAYRASKAQRTRHFESWSGARFGGAPWAKLIFYYRTAEAIDAAGCVERKADTHLELRPSEEPSVCQDDENPDSDDQITKLNSTPKQHKNPLFVSPRDNDDDGEWSDIRVGGPRRSSPMVDEDDLNASSPGQVRKLLDAFQSRKTPMPVEKRVSHTGRNEPPRSQTLALQTPSPRNRKKGESRRKVQKCSLQTFDPNEEAEDSLDEIDKSNEPSKLQEHGQDDALSSNCHLIDQDRKTSDLRSANEDERRSPRSGTMDIESSPEVPLQRKRKAGVSSVPDGSHAKKTKAKVFMGPKAPRDDSAVLGALSGTKSIPLRAASAPVTEPNQATQHERTDDGTAASTSVLSPPNNTIVWVAHSLAGAPGTQSNTNSRKASVGTASATRATAPPNDTATATSSQQLDCSVFLNDLEEMREVKRARLAELEEMRAHVQKVKQLKEMKETLAREIEELEEQKKEERAILQELNAEISMSR